MAVRRTASVVDREGVRGTIRELVATDDHEAVAIVELETGAHVTLPATLLHPGAGDGYSITCSWSQLASEAPGRVVVPVLTEDLAVGVRDLVRERVRVRRRVVTTGHELQTPVWEERVEIEHVPRGEYVQRVPEARREGDVLVLPVVEEVAVVERRLCLREEVRIRIVREKRLDRRTIPVRRHEVDIERELEPELAASSPADPGAHEDEGEEP